MAAAASARKIGRPAVKPQGEVATLGRIQPACNFINAEAARLRHQTIAIGVACGIGAILFPLVTRIIDPRIPLVLAVGAFVLCFVRARMELASIYSGIAVKRIVAAISKTLVVKPKSSLTLQQFVAMDLFAGSVERLAVRSEINGRVGNIKYAVHQVRATGRDGRTPVFDGAIMKLDSTDGFPGHTVIVPDGGQLPGSRVKKDMVLLKNPEFEQQFSVYASDYYDARRLVTPGLMNAILEFAGPLGNNVRLAFVQRSLFIAVSGNALDLPVALFGAPITPEQAVGKLMLLVSFAERLGVSLGA